VTHLDVAGKVYYAVSSHGRLFLLQSSLLLPQIVIIFLSIFHTNRDPDLKLESFWKPD
jgi:hypothetical protein